MNMKQKTIVLSTCVELQSLQVGVVRFIKGEAWVIMCRPGQGEGLRSPTEYCNPYRKASSCKGSTHSERANQG